jgi:hypothetical protein
MTSGDADTVRGPGSGDHLIDDRPHRGYGHLRVWGDRAGNTRRDNVPLLALARSGAGGPGIAGLG